MDDEKLNSEFGIKSLFKDILTEWILTSTSHGLPNFFRTNSTILKIIWACCFLGSTGYCIFSIGVSIQSYCEYNTYISTQIVPEIPAQFPAVSFCNYRFLNKTSSEEFLKKILYVNETPVFSYNDFNFDTYLFIVSQLYFIQASFSATKNLTKPKKSYGFEISDMILSCRFNWGICTADDFYYFFHPMFGNCYTFNIGFHENGTEKPLKTVSMPGPDYGLSIDLFTGDPKIQSEYEIGDGVIVVVHNQSSLPLFNGDRILTRVGDETDIKIGRAFVSKLGEPYSACLKDVSKASSYHSKYFDFIVNQMNISYKVDYCYGICLQEKIEVECNCSLGILPGFGNKDLCLYVSDLDCTTRLVLEFNTKNGSSDCVSSCPIDCDFVEYPVTTSSSKFPSHYYKKQLAKHPKINKSGIAFDDIDEAMLKINVFYEAMRYSWIEEIPSVTLETFMSNLGGSLGLYIGISFLSFVEVIELLVILMKTYAEHKLKQRKTANRDCSSEPRQKKAEK